MSAYVVLLLGSNVMSCFDGRLLTDHVNRIRCVEEDETERRGMSKPFPVCCWGSVLWLLRVLQLTGSVPGMLVNPRESIEHPDGNWPSDL